MPSSLYDDILFLTVLTLFSEFYDTIIRKFSQQKIVIH